MDELAAPWSSEREDAGPPLVEDGIVDHVVCMNDECNRTMGGRYVEVWNVKTFFKTDGTDEI